jgi:Transcriptional regulator of heat shock gene
MVSDRALEVLRVIVEDFIDSSEPVASKAIASRPGFGVSAATIRNDMALLEEEELIAAPHTSAGRIPTDKGYRVL